jgi:hypothetical protein
LGEILANQRNNGDSVTVLHELDSPARDVHRFPPANVGVKGASEVILEDLSFVERPSMMFVLADVNPLFAGCRRARYSLFKPRAGTGVNTVTGKLPWLR